MVIILTTGICYYFKYREMLWYKGFDVSWERCSLRTMRIVQIEWEQGLYIYSSSVFKDNVQVLVFQLYTSLYFYSEVEEVIRLFD